MFKDTLNIVFPEFGEIIKNIEIRHDIVHRNGKTKNGENVVISQSQIELLIDRVKVFVGAIDDQINKLED